MDSREFIYRLDGLDRLIFANLNWFDFARENGADALLDQRLTLGKPIWSFISDPTIRQLFRKLGEKVRKTATAVTLPFRCDSPDCRRFMEMEIRPRAKDGIEFRSRVLREERREPIQLLSADRDHSEGTLIMCSWCKKVSVPALGWVELETAIKGLNLFCASPYPQISHGICEDCARAIRSVLERNGERPASRESRLILSEQRF